MSVLFCSAKTVKAPKHSPRKAYIRRSKRLSQVPPLLPMMPAVLTRKWSEERAISCITLCKSEVEGEVGGAGGGGASEEAIYRNKLCQTWYRKDEARGWSIAIQCVNKCVLFYQRVSRVIYSWSDPVHLKIIADVEFVTEYPSLELGRFCTKTRLKLCILKLYESSEC